MTISSFQQLPDYIHTYTETQTQVNAYSHKNTATGTSEHTHTDSVGDTGKKKGSEGTWKDRGVTKKLQN